MQLLHGNSDSVGLFRVCSFSRQRGPKRLELSGSMVHVMVPHYVKWLKKWKLHSTLSTHVFSVER